VSAATDSLSGPAWRAGRAGARRGAWTRILILSASLFVAVGSNTARASGPAEGVQFPLDRESLAGQLDQDTWDPEAPVDIQSDTMSVNFQRHEIVFQGNVKVRQADFSLTAQRVTAVFGETADDIERIVATGDVAIQKADRVAWGREAVYDRKKSVIVLQGNPRIQQGGNFIQGEKISVFLDQDRMDIQGGVSAEFLWRKDEEDGASAGTGGSP